MTTDTKSTSRRPTHKIYAVSRRNNSDKGYWSEVGAAWAHTDGKGFSLKLDYLPLNGADLTLREAEDKADAGNGGAQ